MVKLREILAERWSANQGRYVEMIDDLQGLADAMPGTPDGAELREKSHKLAGNLGLFGMPEPARIAAEIDGLVVDGVTGSQIRDLATQLRSAIDGCQPGSW